MAAECDGTASQCCCIRWLMMMVIRVLRLGGRVWAHEKASGINSSSWRWQLHHVMASGAREVLTITIGGWRIPLVVKMSLRISAIDANSWLSHERMIGARINEIGRHSGPARNIIIQIFLVHYLLLINSRCAAFNEMVVTVGLSVVDMREVSCVWSCSPRINYLVARLSKEFRRREVRNSVVVIFYWIVMSCEFLVKMRLEVVYLVVSFLLFLCYLHIERLGVINGFISHFGLFGRYILSCSFFDTCRFGFLFSWRTSRGNLFFFLTLDGRCSFLPFLSLVIGTPWGCGCKGRYFRSCLWRSWTFLFLSERKLPSLFWLNLKLRDVGGGFALT